MKKKQSFYKLSPSYKENHIYVNLERMNKEEMEYIENGMYKWTNITEKDIGFIEIVNNVWKSIEAYGNYRTGEVYATLGEHLYFTERMNKIIANMLHEVDDLVKEVEECQSKNCQYKQEN